VPCKQPPNKNREDFMKVKNEDIFMAVSPQFDDEGKRGKSPLTELIAIGFPVRVSYELSKLARDLDDQFKVISQVRDTLIGKHGDGNRIDPSSKNWDAFTGELNEIMQEEVEISTKKKVQLPTKIGDKDIEIKPAILYMLDSFIEVK
jgi:hypothetical protein